MVEVSDSGRVHHAFGGNTYAFVYRFSDDHGATWTTRPIPISSAIGGTIDLAIGAGDVPHLALQGSTTSVWSRLMYLVWSGTSWTSTELDMGTTEKDYPQIVLGFADRPHIFSSAYHPDGASGQSVRHAFYDGAAWVYENVDAGDVYDHENDYYSAFQPEILPDDTIHLVYARHNSGSPELVRATRGPLVSDGWTPTVLAGIDGSFRNAIYVDEVAGGPAVVADGLTSYRETAGTFVASTSSLQGSDPAVLVMGHSLIVAYTSTEPSTRNRLYVSRIDF